MNKQEIIQNFLLEISISNPPPPAKSWTWPKVLVALRKHQRHYKINVRKSDLIQAYRELNLNDPKLFECLIKKPMRKQSGVMVVTVFTSGNPTYKDEDGNKVTQKFSCKHDCYYCPLERASAENNWVEQPRSYLTKEPGVCVPMQMTMTVLNKCMLAWNSTTAWAWKLISWKCLY